MNKLIALLGTGLFLLVSACGNDNGGDVLDAGTPVNNMDASEPGTDAGCNVDPTFASLHTEILAKATCAAGGCHGAAGSGNLRLNGGVAAAYAAATGATDDSASVEFPSRVVPMMPDQSWLYLKLLPNPPRNAQRMPQSCDFIGTCLTECQIAAFRTWILNGAQNN